MTELEFSSSNPARLPWRVGVRQKSGNENPISLVVENSAGEVVFEHNNPHLMDFVVTAANAYYPFIQQKTTLEKKIVWMKGVIEACKRTDRSKTYRYKEEDPVGRVPEPGARWQTPREIADMALKSLATVEPQKVAQKEG